MYISLLSAAHIILAILLIIVVLIQRSESSMGALGGANAVFSGKGVSNILTKATTILAILFMAVSVLIARANYHSAGEQSVVEQVQTDTVQEDDTSVKQEAPLPAAE